jgi:hypothetical protein
MIRRSPEVRHEKCPELGAEEILLVEADAQAR